MSEIEDVYEMGKRQQKQIFLHRNWCWVHNVFGVR